MLYKSNPLNDEGELSRQRAYLVCEKTLSQLSHELGIPRKLILSASESKANGRSRASILSDTVEAIIGAIYLDGGMQNCRKCILEWYRERLAGDLSYMAVKDAKTALQEYLQAHANPLPQYEVIAVSGEQHEQRFYVRCRVEGLSLVSEGSAFSRREAEKEAAFYYLKQLKEDHARKSN